MIPLYTNSRLRADITTTGGLTIVTLRALGRTINGSLWIVERTLTPGAGGAGTATFIDLPDGELHTCSVSSTLSDDFNTMSWVVVHLVREQPGSSGIYTTLLRGSVTDSAALSYPGLQASPPWASMLSPFSIPFPAAAPGAELSLDLGSEQVAQLGAVYFRLACAAVIATRRVHVIVSDADGDIVFRSVSPTTQLTGSTVDYSLAAGHAQAAVLGAVPITQQMNLPPITLAQSYTIATVTENLNGADQFSLAHVFVNRVFAPG